MYGGDLYFFKEWRASKEPLVVGQRQWLDYFIQEDMLFKRN
jgi:hypothetical protein